MLKIAIQQFVSGFNEEQLHSFVFVEEQQTLSDYLGFKIYNPTGGRDS